MGTSSELSRPPGQITADAGIVHVRGDVDEHSVELLVGELGTDRAGLGAVLVGAGVREVDLSQAVFIDSSVVGMILSVAGGLSGTRLQVRGAHGEPLTVLCTVGADALVDLVDV
ncbi:hypothetical protein [Cellulomonas sp. SLBN-39]|uniref:hypothetical protein n=1 Tax=Cellulomonas sp. SLBN-39 TaxID=2768446 RepID=UPI00114DDC56|nr:hypothetical protein [Cellulomonas sp. SLBN-39]TQL01802.1 hypothetical protein FBY24_0861 [Cellulomonas sp. SLBN-39]